MIGKSTILMALVATGAAGCGTNAAIQSAAQPANTIDVRELEEGEGDFNDVTPLPAGHDLGDIHSHLFGLEGRLLSVSKTGTLLRYVTVEVIRGLPNAVGWQPYDKFGDVVDIHFDTRVANFDILQMRRDCIIEVWYGQIDNSMDWGSNLAWLSYWDDGIRYGIEGKSL